MAKLSELSAANIRGITDSDSSLCASLAKTLNADIISVTSTTKSPEEIVEAILDSRGFGLTINERRLLPNLILQSAYDQFQNAFAIEVIKNYATNDRFWRRLFRSWLLEYNLSAPAAELVTRELSRKVDKLPSNLKSIANRYPVLSMSPDFRETALALLNGEMSKDDRSSLGLSEVGNALTGPAKEILISCVKVLRSASATEKQIKSFRALVAPSGTIHSSVRLYAMIGLILGVADRPSGEALIKDVSNLIEKNFDDPVSEKHSWPSVPNVLGGNDVREKCLGAVRKWQVFRSITLFFKIIEQVVDSEHKHQFPARRKFWLSYFDRGEVTDAWVILGSKARERMIQLKNQNVEEFHALKWGSLSGGPSDQCALLMKLGNTTVMELSHSGRARMWSQRGSTKDHIPVLHNATYQAAKLRAECPDDQKIRHDDKGRWRIKAQRCIQKLAGGASKI
jgi:hypothetical protein